MFAGAPGSVASAGQFTIELPSAGADNAVVISTV